MKMDYEAASVISHMKEFLEVIFLLPLVFVVIAYAFYKVQIETTKRACLNELKTLECLK